MPMRAACEAAARLARKFPCGEGRAHVFTLRARGGAEGGAVSPKKERRMIQEVLELYPVASRFPVNNVAGPSACGGRANDRRAPRRGERLTATASKQRERLC